MQPLRAFIPTVMLFIRIFRFQTYPMRLFNIMFLLIYRSLGVIYTYVQVVVVFRYSILSKSYGCLSKIWGCLIFS